MKIYAYCRVSTGNQKTDSQKKAISDYCKHHRIKSIWFEDIASGRTTKRNNLSVLLSQAKEGDKILVTDLTRFARNVRDTLTLVSDLMNKGVSLTCINHNLTFDRSAMSQFMLTVFAALAELDSNLKSERIRNGLRASKKARKNRPLSANREQVAKMLRTKSPAEVATHYGVTTRAIYLMRSRQTGV